MVAKIRLGTRSGYSLDFAQVPTKNVRGKIKRFCRQRGLKCEIFSFSRSSKDHIFVLRNSDHMLEMVETRPASENCIWIIKLYFENPHKYS